MSGPIKDYGDLFDALLSLDQENAAQETIREILASIST